MKREEQEFNLTKDRTNLKNCEIDLSVVDVSLNPDAEVPNAYRLLVDKPY